LGEFRLLILVANVAPSGAVASVSSEGESKKKSLKTQLARRSPEIKAGSSIRACIAWRRLISTGSLSKAMLWATFARNRLPTAKKFLFGWRLSPFLDVLDPRHNS